MFNYFFRRATIHHQIHEAGGTSQRPGSWCLSGYEHSTFEGTGFATQELATQENQHWIKGKIIYIIKIVDSVVRKGTDKIKRLRLIEKLILTNKFKNQLCFIVYMLDIFLFYIFSYISLKQSIDLK